MANVIPLYKARDQMSVNKIYEKIVYKRPYDFIVLHNILYENQFGFREKQSS